MYWIVIIILHSTLCKDWEKVILKKMTDFYNTALLLASFLAIANGEDSNSIFEIDQEGQDDIDGGSGEKRMAEDMFPNIGYLFRGYNRLSGNPMNFDVFDPGFKETIFKVEYKKGRRTDDRRYILPDNANIISKSACTDSVQVDSIMTASEYQEDLSTKAAVSGSYGMGIVQASFTASTEYSKTSKSLKSNDKSIIKSEASCTVYEASVHTGTPPPVTENFLAFVKKMVEKKNYVEFLNTFGTHFVNRIEMGARYVKLEVISKKSLESLEKDNIDVSLEAGVSSATVGSASVNTGVSTAKENSNKYNNAFKNERTVTIGSKIPADGSKKSWREAVINKPMPISYQLKEITELFTEDYFTIDGVDLVEVGERLSEALKGYCEKLKADGHPDAECEGPPKGCEGGSQCSINAKCTNNPGSSNKDELYTCTCKEGFQGDGKICQRELIGIPTLELQHGGNVLSHGTWGIMDMCPNGGYAQGFQLRVAEEESTVTGDNTAANSICIICNEYEQRCSKQGLWGVWSNEYKCPDGSFLSGWRQNMQTLSSSDDTGLNNVEYECKDLETKGLTKRLKGSGNEFEDWGEWSRFKRCPKGQFICGLKTRVAPYTGDDTALNDIIHKCCKSKFSERKMLRMFKKISKRRKTELKSKQKMKNANGSAE